MRTGTVTVFRENGTWTMDREVPCYQTWWGRGSLWPWKSPISTAKFVYMYIRVCSYLAAIKALQRL